jgi:hypothetical protein
MEAFMDRDEMRKAMAELLRARLNGDGEAERAALAVLAAKSRAAVHTMETAARFAAGNDNA